MYWENQFPSQTFFGTFSQDGTDQNVVHLDGLYQHQDEREVTPPQYEMGGDETPPAPPHNKNDRPQNPIEDKNKNIPRVPQQYHNNNNGAEAEENQHH